MSKTVETPRERIGVFGGSFDPIHIGHLAAAVSVRFALKLDRVLMIVANQPWQKLGAREVTSARTRLQAVEAAVVDVEGLEASSLEVERGSTTYTVDTLRELRLLHSNAEFFLIMGDDTAARLETWREPQQIAQLAELVVVNRPGTSPVAISSELGWSHDRVHRVEMPGLDVSSTDLRARMKDGRPLDILIPTAAIAILRSQGQ